MSTNVPNLKQIGGGHRKNGQKFVDLMWNDPIVNVRHNVLESVTTLFKLAAPSLSSFALSYI